MNTLLKDNHINTGLNTGLSLLSVWIAINLLKLFKIYISLRSELLLILSIGLILLFGILKVHRKGFNKVVADYVIKGFKEISKIKGLKRYIPSKETILNIKYYSFVKKYSKYVFLLFLLLVTISSLEFDFLINSWFGGIINYLKSIQMFLTITSIVFGIITFWTNREVIDEIEEEAKDEEKAEIKRAKEFDSKFKRLSWFNFNYGVKEAFKDKYYFKGIFRVIISPFVWFARLPYSFVKWMYKEGWWYSVGLILIVLIGFVLRICLAIFSNYNLDEGIHTYDAKLIQLGKIPFVDYFSREPYYMYTLSLFQKITSNNIFYTRLFSVIISVICIIILYKIIKEKNKLAGILGITLFAISPFIAYETFLGNLYTLFYLFLLLTVWQLLKYLKTKNLKHLMMTGLLLGVGVHIYRIFILYILAIYLYFTIYTNLKKLEKFNLIIFTAIPFLVPIITFSLLAGYNNFEVIYGTNELLIIFSIAIVFLINPLSKISSKYRVIFHKPLGYYVITTILVCLITYFYFNGNLTKDIKIRIVYQGFILSSFFIILLSKSIIYLFEITKLHKFKYLIISLIMSFYLVIISNGPKVASNLRNYGVRPHTFYEDLFIILVIFAIILTLAYREIKIKLDEYYFVNLLFCIIPIFFYFTHVQIFTNIFLATSISSIPLISIYLIKYISSTKKYRYIILFVLVLIFLFPFFFQSQGLNDRPLDQKLVQEVVSKIHRLDSTGKYIFTAEPIFATETNKEMILYNSRPTIYNEKSLNDLKTPTYINLTRNLPPLDGFIATIEEEEVKIVVMGPRTKNLIKSNPCLNDFINSNYHLEQNYQKGIIEIWIKN